MEMPINNINKISIEEDGDGSAMSLDRR